MSVDWTVVCDECKEYHHLGQNMGCTCSFGYGEQDHSGRVAAGEFISAHLYHQRNFSDNDGLRIVLTDDIPHGYLEIQL